jgi:uncharacterized membrane protein
MSANLANFGPWLAVAAMAAITYSIRAGGFWLMGHVTLTPRLRKMLEALPGAVVVATVLPLVLREGLVAVFAIAVALAVMALRRNDLLGVACGIAVAATSRWFGL